MSSQQETAYDDLEYTGQLFLLHGQLFSGTAIDRHSDGRKRSEIHFLNGREHGIARSWYPNGQLQGETPYVDGVMHGVRRELFEDGALRSEESIEYGILMRREVRNCGGEVIERWERSPSDILYQNAVKRRATAAQHGPPSPPPRE